MTAHRSSTLVPVATEVDPPREDVFLTECASCGGQFPSFRAICAECEDVAEDDGYRDGRKVVGVVAASGWLEPTEVSTDPRH